MSLPEIVSRETWLEARKDFLRREKELTRLRDALNSDRRRLPMVRIDKPYMFDGPTGRVSLLDLFAGHRQLIVQHFMFDPEWEAGCPSCTGTVDQYNPNMGRMLEKLNTRFVLVSRAPSPKLARYAADRGWTWPWYSSVDSDFNYDFHVSLDESKAPVEYNYRAKLELEQTEWKWVTEGPNELPGNSCFIRQGDEIYHTYSTYARGVEQVTGVVSSFLDMTVLGRQEPWEEPKGRAADLFSD